MKKIILCICCLALFACTKQENPTVPEAVKAPAPPASESASPKFTITDIRLGSGKEAKMGATLKVNYTAWLYDPAQKDKRGKKYESTYDKDAKPFEFQLGAGDLIRGWEQGFFGLREGGVRELIIPPEMGYGSQGFPTKVPGNAAIVYEIELKEVK